MLAVITDAELMIIMPGMWLLGFLFGILGNKARDHWRTIQINAANRRVGQAEGEVATLLCTIEDLKADVAFLEQELDASIEEFRREL